MKRSAIVIRRRMSGGVSAARLPGAAEQNTMGFFITSAGSGDGANLGGLGGRRQALSDARRGGRRRQPHVARVSERGGGRQSAGGQRARSHRRGSVAQREGRAGRRERGRSAQRQEPALEGELADREGRRGERPRRHAESATTS